MSRGAAGLFLDPGVGKTSIVLAAFMLLQRRKMARGMLVVAPRRPARMVWSGANGENTKWRDFRDLSVGLVHGPRKDRVVMEDHDYYITTPDSLDWLLHGRVDRKPPWSILKSKVDVLNVDESSKFKNSDTVRFRRIKPMLDHFSSGRRWITTGSPATNGLLNLWAQIFMLDGGKRLGEYFSFYRNKYFECYDKEYNRWKLRDEKEEQRIYRALRGLVMRLEAGDYIKMPQIQEVPIKIDLPPAVREVYDEMETHNVIDLGENIVAAWNPGGVNMKLKQLANGAVYINEKKDVAVIHDEKLDALEELIDELEGAPLLVGVEFLHDVERIRARFGNVPYLGGGMSDKAAEELQVQWNAGAIPLLLGHPASMGHGLNFQGAAQHVAWFSIPIDYDLYDQFIRRVARQGNPHMRVFVHLLMVVDTIDEDNVRALKVKERNQNRLLDAVAAFTLKRVKQKLLRTSTT